MDIGNNEKTENGTKESNNGSPTASKKKLKSQSMKNSSLNESNGHSKNSPKLSTKKSGSSNDVQKSINDGGEGTTILSSKESTPNLKRKSKEPSQSNKGENNKTSVSDKSGKNQGDRSSKVGKQTKEIEQKNQLSNSSEITIRKKTASQPSFTSNNRNPQPVTSTKPNGKKKTEQKLQHKQEQYEEEEEDENESEEFSDTDKTTPLNGENVSRSKLSSRYFYSEEEMLQSLPKIQKRDIKTSYSPEEVAKHNTVDDMWLIINKKVYDITPYAYIHPGSTKALLKFAGKDGSENVQFHSPKMMWLLDNYFLIGYLEGYSDSCTVM